MKKSIVVLKGASNRQEIQVPAGESHFHILQHGKRSKQEFIFHLHHPESRVKITGTVQASQGGEPELLTQVIHHVPFTFANTLIRTLAAENAHPRYQGLIRIEKQAKGCESYLSHHSLLIGPGAKSWSIPSLEILSDEVKCSHSATVKTITNLDLFYLRSRGLNPEMAKQVLIKAFLTAP